MKALKIAGIVLGALAVLLLAGIAYVALSFDEIRVKNELARMVQEKTRRSLNIDGELTLSFWPRLGVRIGHAALSERGSDQAFAALESAHFSVRMLPLLSKKIVIDQVELSGVQAALLRRLDGSLNIDDLLAPDGEPTLKFDLAGIKIANARLGWRNEMSGRDVTLSKLQFTSGRIANAAQGKLELFAQLNGGNPHIDSAIQLNAIYDYDIVERRFSLSQLDARIAGLLFGLERVEVSMGAGAINLHPRGNQHSSELQIEALTLSANGKAGNAPFELMLAAPQLLLAADKTSAGALMLNAKYAGAQGMLDARLDLSGIEGTPQTMKASQLALLLDAQIGATTLKSAVSSPWVADLSARTMELPGFSGEIQVANPLLPMKQLKLPLSGALFADFARHWARGAASSQLDQSKIKAKFHLSEFVPLALSFAVDIDKINLDRYFPPRQDDETSTNGGGEQTVSQLFGSPAPTTLKPPKLQGSVRIGALHYARVEAKNVRLELKSADGRLRLESAASRRNAEKLSPAVIGTLPGDSK